MNLQKIFRFLHFATIGGGQKCISCNTEIFDESPLCDNCQKTLVQNQTFCQKCGMPVASETPFCNRCQETNPCFETARSCFVYGDVAKGILVNYKINCIKQIGDAMSDFLLELWQKYPCDIDFVTFVPSANYAKTKRRFDTCKYLAQKFCQKANLPLVETLKCNIEREQKTLTRKQRRESVHGKFPVVDKSLVEGKNILLVDDLVTTASTISECSKSLTKAKANKVFVFSVFSTPQPLFNSIKE